MTLAGRKIVVTGAAAGIGAATRKLLNAAGAEVIALDRTSPADINGTYVPCDLSDRASIAAAIERLPADLDGLANVAGIPGMHPAEAVFRVNFLGLRELTEGVIDRLRPGGAIVNVASIAGSAWQLHMADLAELVTGTDFESGLNWYKENGPTAGADAYNFSKEAVLFYTKHRSHSAWSRGVRINAVNPGATTTAILDDFRKSMPEGSIDWSEREIGRHASPEDAAAAVAFLLGPGSSFINGADIPVDGGLLAGVTVGTIKVNGENNA
jgi:NAD(P)-dependent dehydrogenase (short-subunit alcohol dehydrogenase family)